MSAQTATGGCQCGAVRYEATMPPGKVSYCHCRMCQKAFGNLFALLAPFKRTQLHFTQPPAVYRSSSVAERGFCSACGTPLTFAYLDSEWIAVSVGSFDDPAQFPPGVHYGVEGQVSWLHIVDELPRLTTGEEDSEGRLKHLLIHQHPDR
ncbi:MAG: GFA family protein [Gemmatimonadaceae bacterium]|nr:GFA family protein [Gloeobacterales cyanobacterium ES-bin-141]